MRELERINRICNILKEKWRQVPDERLGQFLINHVFGSYPPYDSYIFFKEDDEIEEILRLL